MRPGETAKTSASDVRVAIMDCGQLAPSVSCKCILGALGQVLHDPQAMCRGQSQACLQHWGQVLSRDKCSPALAESSSGLNENTCLACMALHGSQRC